MDFKFKNWRKRQQQSFDRENIYITKAGVKYNVYDKIQEAREDTEIYPTLEKYGCIEGHMMADNEKMFADFTEFRDLRTMKDQQIKADEMFYALPLEVRQKFNNDKNVFMRDGEKWLKDKIAEEMTTEQTFEHTEEKGDNNG